MKKLLKFVVGPVGIVALSISIALGLMVFVPKANAIKEPVCDASPGGGPYGRCWARGYFTNEARHSSSGTAGGNHLPAPAYWYYTDVTGLTNWWVVPPTIQNGNPQAAEHFINQVYYNLFFNNYYLCLFNGTNGQVDKTQPCFDNRRNVLTAAWTIDVMLGKPGWHFGDGDTGIQNGIQFAKDNFNQWANIVRKYQDAGLIEWNAWRVHGPHVNTTGVGVGYAGRDIDAFWYGFYGEGNEFVDAIIFKHPVTGADVFEINRTCWNAIGSELGLPPIDFNNVSYLTQGVPGNAVDPGGEYQLNWAIHNFGNGSFDRNFSPGGLPAALRVQNQNSNFVTSTSISGTGSVYGASGGSYIPANDPNVNHSCGYGSQAPGGAPRSPCWLWTYNHLDKVNTAGSVANVNFKFGVAPNTPPGTRLCFQPFASWQTSSDSEYQGSQYCVIVSSNPPVLDKPYLRVYGGDVLAGSGFGPTCTVPSDAKITTFTNGTNGAGSGTQYGAQAITAIDQFSSAMLRSAPNNPVPPKGLSFGNESGTYGGNFGSGFCGKNYFNDITTGSDPGAIYNGANVANGQRLVLKHDGDIVIRGNVIYTGSGAWANISQIPSFYLVVKGNIYISKDVTTLDGVYIAQPTTANPDNTGKIYTCTQTDGSRYTSAQLSGNCGNKLTINGAFIAKQVHFLRTTGKVANATVGEPSTSANIAEVFNYSPELWLVNPGLGTTTNTPYDSIANLPPVL